MWDLGWTKWHWDRIFSEFFGFPCQYHSTVASRTHISSREWTRSQLVAAVQRRFPSRWHEQYEQRHPEFYAQLPVIFSCLPISAICPAHPTSSFSISFIITVSTALHGSRPFSVAFSTLPYLTPKSSNSSLLKFWCHGPSTLSSNISSV
jgi:hypothetical protein